MVVVYKTNPITYLIGKQLVRLDRIGMVNILLNEMVVPELIQSDASAEKIIESASGILSDNRICESIKNKLEKVREKLGSEGASAKAAGSILEVLNESKKN